MQLNLAPMDNPSEHTESQNQVRYEDMVAVVKQRGETGLTDLPGCEDSLKTLEATREKYLEDWMTENKYDVGVVFPTNGDVALADSDENYDSMLDALRDGVKYANGGRSLKHLGVPCITVPMGNLEEEKMPVGLSSCGRAYQGPNLLRYAFAYEAASKRREGPPLAPSLLSDYITLSGANLRSASSVKPVLKIGTSKKVNDSPDLDVRVVTVTGTSHLASSTGGSSSLGVFANGEPSSPVT